MATGKERGYKDWKLSKEFKRSARTYSEEEVVSPPKTKKGSSAKWCKRKVGREHDFVKGSTTFHFAGCYPWQLRDEWRTHYKCSACGKEKTKSIFRDVQS